LPDIIQLLPDNIANQIAAGEVIQRPASAVKELLENAVDAGATEIRLLIQDAGKALIQVIDNGKGMSETDARMCFERHATSKIHQIDDLFRIRTMGFRGEALASIAAVAQVELKSKRAEDMAGTYIEVENSLVKLQEPVAAITGTSIAMKNLFFNIPARRNFLKSNAAETRHIVDEFIRVALSFPDIFFSLTANGQEMFHLEKGTLKQRIVQSAWPSIQCQAGQCTGRDRLPEYLRFCGQTGGFQKNPGRPVLLCQQPLYPQRLPQPCGDERLPGNDRAGQLPAVCAVH
jgi:DNA mismatch repair protein MutL